jgi:hypothetical protein
VNLGKKEMVLSLIEQARKFRFCGPSDDPDEQRAVTIGYRDLTTKLKRLAGPMLSKDAATRLNAINVEFNDLYSAFDASSELEALFPDIEAALAHLDEDSAPKPGNAPNPLPVPVCVIVGKVIGSYIYNHRVLERMFYEAGARGEVPEGNCVTKCQSWLRRLHTEVADPAAVLGKFVEEFMEVDGTAEVNDKESGRQKIREALARYGWSYQSGGRILGAATALPTKSLHQILKERDLAEVEKEFSRSLAHVEADPPAAITAACSILESLFKVYIEESGIDMPADESLKPLWKTREQAYRVRSRCDRG